MDDMPFTFITVIGIYVYVTLFILQMTDFIEGNFLKEQVAAIKELGDHISNLQKLGPDSGEYFFDKETLRHT